MAVAAPDREPKPAPELKALASSAKLLPTAALQVISEEQVEDVGLLDARGLAVPVTRVALGTFSRKGGQPGFRY